MAEQTKTAAVKTEPAKAQTGPAEESGKENTAADTKATENARQAEAQPAVFTRAEPKPEIYGITDELPIYLL